MEKVLGELDSLGKPRIEVLNKIDLLGEHEREGLLARGQSGAAGEVAVSARTGEGMEALLEAIDRGAALRSADRGGAARSAAGGRGAGGDRGGDGGAQPGVRGQPGAADGERAGVADGAAAAVPAAGRRQ